MNLGPRLIASVALLIAIPLSARAMDIPTVETRVLPNGMTVLLRHDAAIPLMTVHFQSKAGSLQDPAGMAGVATLMGQALRSGAGDWDEAQLDGRVASLGAQIEVGTSLDVLDITGDVPTIASDGGRHLISMVAALVRRPHFESRAVAKVKARQLAELAAVSDNVSELANYAFAARVFPMHPHGRHPLGTVASLSGLTRDDVARFHAEHVRADNSVIAIAGDFDVDVVMEQLTAQFGTPFGKAGKARPALPKMPSTTQPRVVLVDSHNAQLKQAQFRVGGALPYRWSDPGQTAYFVAAEIVGGDFSSRLNTRLRVKEGLTYGARWISDFDDEQSRGAYLSSYTSPKDVVRALRITLEELEHVKAKGFESEELKRVVDRLTRGFVFRFETPALVIDQWLGLWLNGLKPDRLSQLPERAARLTVADLNAASGPFDPSRVTIVVVGNEAMRAPLKEFASSINAAFEVVDLPALGLK